MQCPSHPCMQPAGQHKAQEGDCDGVMRKRRGAIGWDGAVKEGEEAGVCVAVQARAPAATPLRLSFNTHRLQVCRFATCTNSADVL
jgi:hypothetical protein